MIHLNMQMTTPRLVRIFLGGIRQEAREGWLDLCREAIAAIGPTLPIDECNHIYEPGQFDAFLRALRPNEAAVLPCLLALDERPPEGGRPGVAFHARLGRLERRCLYVVDAEPAPILRSSDGEAWDEHVDRTYSRVTKRRVLAKKKAAQMARKKKAIHPGIVADFTSRARAGDRKSVRVIWTSKKFANADEAIVAIGEQFPELEGMSRSTAERITGLGRNGKPKKRATRGA